MGCTVQANDVEGGEIHGQGSTYVGTFFGGKMVRWKCVLGKALSGAFPPGKSGVRLSTQAHLFISVYWRARAVSHYCKLQLEIFWAVGEILVFWGEAFPADTDGSDNSLLIVGIDLE